MCFHSNILIGNINEQVCRILDESFSQSDGPTITVARGSISNIFPVSLRSLGSPSSNSSAHNITEEESQGDVQIPGKVDGHFTRLTRHHGSKHSKGSSLSSNTPSNMSSANSITSAGLVVWDMVRETLSRTRRPHSKDKNNHHIDDGKRSISTTSSSPTASANDREAAAIAILENVIDHFNPLPTASNNNDAAANSGTHKVRDISF